MLKKMRFEALVGNDQGLTPQIPLSLQKIGNSIPVKENSMGQDLEAARAGPMRQSRRQRLMHRVLKAK